MEPYEDPRLSPEGRTSDLLSRLSVAEKAGLLFHSMLGSGEPGAVDAPSGPQPIPQRELVAQRFINHFNLHEVPGPRQAARWQNSQQDLAAQTPHGIPITFSTDPRHSFTRNSGVAFASGRMSQWPEGLGLAAIGDIELVRRFGEVVLAVLAKHRLGDDLRVVDPIFKLLLVVGLESLVLEVDASPLVLARLSRVVAINSQPMHLATAAHQILADDRNIIFALAGDHASGTTRARRRINRHLPHW